MKIILAIIAAVGGAYFVLDEHPVIYGFVLTVLFIVALWLLGRVL